MLNSNSSFRGYLLIVLVVLFFITSLTLFLLLIQGKRITPTGEIIETGLIRVNSIPSNVTVLIDGERVSKSGNLIQNIPLGEVHIELTREGYTSWEKTIKVDSVRVKEIFAQLYPEDLNLNLVQAFEADQIKFSNNFSDIYYTILNSDEVENGIWRQQLDQDFLDFNTTNAPILIYEFNQEDLELLLTNPYSLLVSPDNRSIILNIEGISIARFQTSESSELEDLDELIGFYPEKFDWLSGGDSILISNENILYELNLRNGSKDLVTYNPNQAPTFCITNNAVYWKGTEDLIYKYEAGNSMLIEETDELVLPFNNIINISCTENEDVIIVEDVNGLNYLDLNLEYLENLGQNVSVKDISNDGRNVILQAGESVYSVYNVIEIRQNSIIETEINPLTIQGDIYFSQSNNSMIILSQSDGGYKIEIADIDGTNSSEIIDELSININNELPVLRSNNRELLIFSDDSEEISDSLNNNLTLYSVDLTE